MCVFADLRLSTNTPFSWKFPSIVSPSRTPMFIHTGTDESSQSARYHSEVADGSAKSAIAIPPACITCS
jgi:hypothetical protein